MPVQAGFYDSPLERKARIEWERTRNTDLKAAEPLVPTILGSQRGEPQGSLADLAGGFSGPGLALGQQSLAFQGQMPTDEAAMLRQGGLRAQDFFSQLQQPPVFGPQQDPFAGVRTLAPQLEAEGLSGGQFQQFLGGAVPQGGPTLQGAEQRPEVPFAEQGQRILEEIFGEVGGGAEPPQFLAGGPLAPEESIGPLQAGAIPEAVPVSGLRPGGPLKPLQGNPFLTSIFGEEQIEGLRLFLEDAPGPISLAAGPVANSVNVLTAPAGVLGAGAAGPRITLIAEGSSITAGTGAAALGADERVQIAAEITAGIGVPVAAGPALGAARGAFRRPTAITGEVLERGAPARPLAAAGDIIEGEVIRPGAPARPLGVTAQPEVPRLTGARTTEPPGTAGQARESVARRAAPVEPRAAEGVAGSADLQQRGHTVANDLDHLVATRDGLDVDQIARLSEDAVRSEFGSDPVVTLYRGTRDIPAAERGIGEVAQTGTGRFWTLNRRKAEGYALSTVGGRPAENSRLLAIDLPASEAVNPVLREGGFPAELEGRVRRIPLSGERAAEGVAPSAPQQAAAAEDIARQRIQAGEEPTLSFRSGGDALRTETFLLRDGDRSIQVHRLTGEALDADDLATSRGIHNRQVAESRQKGGREIVDIDDATVRGDPSPAADAQRVARDELRPQERLGAGGVHSPEVEAKLAEARAARAAQPQAPTAAGAREFDAVDRAIAEAKPFDPLNQRPFSRLTDDQLQDAFQRVESSFTVSGEQAAKNRASGRILSEMNQRGITAAGPEAELARRGLPPMTGAEARSPTGVQLPDRGTRAAQEALNLKEETLLRPGRVTQSPGIKQALSSLNPSVSIDRSALVSYNARQAVTASLETEFAAQRLSVAQELQAAWDATTPRYTGPANNALKNTIKDWADNPEFYTGVSTELRAAATAYDDVSNEILARGRGDYNVDINAFDSGKEGSFYLPTVQARETLDDSLTKVADGYSTASISGKSGRAKGRVYEGAYQRTQRNPGFKAETDLAELTSLHDRALATMAGNETFRYGVGGKTRLEVMAEVHPNLHGKMTGLRQRLANLRGQVGRLNTKLAREIDDFLIDPDGSLSDIADALDVRVTRGKLKGENVQGVNAEINRVRREMRDLRPAWEGANLEPFVLNRKTFRYHTAEQSAAVDKLLLTKLPIGDGLVDAIDEVRLFAFAGDVSPLTIQGMLGIMADPVTGARSLPGVSKALLSPENLTEIAAREPELVGRFTQATGRPFGVVSSEFVQRARGIERIPVVGKELNDRLMAAVELIRYNQWKVDQSVLRRLNPGMTQNVADAEAANVLSKIIPALNPAERGASRLQSRLERVPVISTSFIGGPPTLIKDAASGMAKLTGSRTLNPAARWQGLSGREQLAIIRLGTMAGTLVTAGIASHIASGWSPEDAAKVVLDPNSSRFLSIALGGERRIPVGGPLRSAVRAFIPRKTGEVKGVPVYVPFQGVPQWLKGKVTPAISAPIDLARNKDYFGGKIGAGSFPENALRMLWFAVNNVLPLGAAEPSEALRRGEVDISEPEKLAERSAAQFAGVDLRETSPFDRLQEYVQSQRPGQDTPDELVTRLGRQLAAQGDSQAARLVKDFERGGSVFSTSGAARRDALSQEVNAVVEETGLRDVAIKGLEGNLDASAQFAREYGDLRRDRAVISQFQSRGVDFPEPSSELGELVASYYAISPFQPEFRDPDTTEPDFDAFRAAQKKVLAEIEAKDTTLARSIDQRPIFNPDDEPELAQIEARFLEAKKLRDQLPSPVSGLHVEDYREVRSFLSDVQATRRQWAADTGDPGQLEPAIIELGRQAGKEQPFIEWAVVLRGGIPDRFRSPEYDQALFRNEKELQAFFPELFSSQRVAELQFEAAQAR